ncbi:MAG: SUMF1/EgtB/PvdO family nonheme iron enzyme [Gemmataceae bacterium]|nr:SUMF1/EgtB/PvdO family nonheme iron enzyme [Gemmataceae bacterium]
MGGSIADQNLLLGTLAVEMGLVSREALDIALNAWEADRAQPLGRLLVELGALPVEKLPQLEEAVRKQQELASRNSPTGHNSATGQELADDYRTLREAPPPPRKPAPGGQLAETTPPSRPDPPSTSTQRPRPAPLPLTTERYIPIKLHAKGGLGEVYLATDEELHREVALKEIQAHCAGDHDSRARFLLEAEITGRLEHPGVVPVYGLGVHADGRPYYAMRFIRGDSLKDAITAFHKADDAVRDPGERQVELRQLLGRFTAVCNTLAYAHARGVLHRDIKPANIMLGPYGETLVVDWGLAKTIGQAEMPRQQRAGEQPLRTLSGVSTETLPGEAIGTPAYMSPEQAAGRRAELGPATDIYSLGATLYHLLTGQSAMHGTKDLMALMTKVQLGQFPRPRQVKKDVPAALEAVCLKAMALKPQDRYASAKDLADDLDRWLADEPVSAYREPLRTRVARWVRRHQAPVTGAAALLVTAVVALAVSTVLIGDALRSEEAARKREETARIREATQRKRAEVERARAVEAQGKEKLAREQAEAAQRLEEKARLREEAERKRRALAQAEALRTANPRAVPALLDSLRATREDVLPRLRELWEQDGEPQNRGRRARVGLALLALDNADVQQPLFAWMLEAPDPQETLLMRDALLPHRQKWVPVLWQRAQDAKETPEERLRALVALAAFDPDDPRWPQAGRQVAERLLSANPLYLGAWMEALRPVRRVLIAPLAGAFRGAHGVEQRQVAAQILADYASDQPEFLGALALDADPRQWSVLLPRLQAHRAAGVAFFQKELQRQPPAPEKVEERDALARRQAQAAVALLQLGRPEAVWPLLRHTPDPSRRTYLTLDLGRLGSDPDLILKHLAQGPKLDVSERRALISSLGEYGADQLPPDKQQEVVKLLLGWYRDDPDPGIHSMIDWLLRYGKRGAEPRRLAWGQAAALGKLDAELAGQEPGKRDWYVTRDEGHTLAVVRGPVEFRMGSPLYEPQRDDFEVPHRKRIRRSFALGTKEVTVAQFRRFLEKNPSYRDKQHPGRAYNPDDAAPELWVLWTEAAAYCNWLSAQDGIPKDQWCYIIDPKTHEVRTPEDCLQRTGYRLPTEAEWEFACRAGATTSRFYGSADGLLGEFAWYAATSNNRTWPVGELRPNDLGLFDVYGNAWEWCQERPKRYSVEANGAVLDTPDLKAAPDGSRVIRGASFNNPTFYTRSASRSNGRGSVRYMGQGFRIARTYP